MVTLIFISIGKKAPAFAIPLPVTPLSRVLVPIAVVHPALSVRQSFLKVASVKVSIGKSGVTCNPQRAVSDIVVHPSESTLKAR